MSVFRYRFVMLSVRLLPAVAAGLLAAGCATNSIDAPLAVLSKPDGLISEDKESELGRREHPKIVSAFGGDYHDEQLQAGLEELVNRLTRVSERPDLRYRVTVLNSPTVNAFALPGGFVYVTRGLLALANDEDELAAVLSHEIGHVTARHAAKRQSEAIKAVFVGRVASILDKPESGDGIKDSDNLLASFSRRQELEADQIGVETSVKAGFDPFAAASFLEAMARDTNYRQSQFGREPDAHRPNLQASHPTTPERIGQVRRLAREFGFAPGERRRQKRSYLTLIDGMLYGDDPRGGYVRGHTFLHPRLRIAFTVPASYTLHNTSDAVFAIGPDDTALRFDGIELPETQNLNDYVRSVWGNGAAVNAVHVLDGAQPGVIASARFDGWDYRLAAVRVSPREVYRFLLARRTIDEESQRIFSDIVASLRRLDDAEAKRLRPLRLRMIEVQPGDTVAGLARRMIVPDEAESQFRLLNGLSSTDQLRAGDRVKIIAD